MMKKLLISYSGHARSYKSVLDSHIVNLIDPLSKCFQIHIKGLFHEFDDMNSSSVTDLDYIKSTFEKYSCDICVVDKEEMCDILSRNYSHIFRVEHRNGYSQLHGLASMFYLMQKSLDYNQYDIRLRIRPDLKFLSQIDNSSFSDKSDVYFPRFGHFGGGRNDQLFALTKKVVDFLPYTNEVCKNSILSPEPLVGKCLSKYSQSYIDSINYVIQRPDGNLDCQRRMSRIGDI